jgi:N-acetylmuramoyl-L-alanine amidase
MSDQPVQDTPDVPEIANVEHVLPELPIVEESPVEAMPVEEAIPVEPVRESTPVQPRRSTPVPQKLPRYTLITTVSVIRSLSVTFAAAVIVATIFMWWTSPEFLSAETRRGLAPVQATADRIDKVPTSIPTPFWINRVGILAGHSGLWTLTGQQKTEHDPGTVCTDGFTEGEVTLKVAKQVATLMQGRGFSVDILEEYDPKLQNYKAAVLISLHADSCQVFDDGFNHSGFKPAYPIERFTIRDQDLRLDECIRQNYAASTGLEFKPAEITVDMTKYYAWHRIASSTPASILELGNLHYDRDLLQNHTDKLAEGVTRGLLCYLNPIGQATSDAAQKNSRPVVPTATPTLPLALPTNTTQSG